MKISIGNVLLEYEHGTALRKCIIVGGTFCCHLVDSRYCRQTCWRVSHVRSGCLVSCSAFMRLKRAIQFCGELWSVPGVDWSSKGHRITANQKSKIYNIINNGRELHGDMKCRLDSRVVRNFKDTP